jgi:hypothetical protein
MSSSSTTIDLTSQLEDVKSLLFYLEILKRQQQVAQRDLTALEEFKRSLEEDEDEEEEEQSLFLDEKKLFIMTQTVPSLPDIDWSQYNHNNNNNNNNNTNVNTEKKVNGTKRKREEDDSKSKRKSRSNNRK